MLLLSLFLACGGEETVDKAGTEKTTVEAKASEKDKKMEKKPHAKEGHGHSHKGGEGADPGPVADGAKVFFVSPKNGEKVKSPVAIKMGVEGMKVQKAADGIVAGTGHHHIIINSDSIKKGMPVPPNDDKHQHFGGGQTETTLELEPGEHTLRLQFANGAHISYGPQLEEKITITVTK